MKSIPYILLAVFAMVQCRAHESSHIFIGQNHKNGVATTAFVLDLIDPSDAILMNDQGELYVKVDRIVRVPKENLFDVMAVREIQELPLEQLTQEGSAKLKDLGVSQKLLNQIDAKQEKLQRKLQQAKARVRK